MRQCYFGPACEPDQWPGLPWPMPLSSSLLPQGLIIIKLWDWEWERKREERECRERSRERVERSRGESSFCLWVQSHPGHSHHPNRYSFILSPFLSPISIPLTHSPLSTPLYSSTLSESLYYYVILVLKWFSFLIIKSILHFCPPLVAFLPKTTSRVHLLKGTFSFVNININN